MRLVPLPVLLLLCCPVLSQVDQSLLWQEIEGRQIRWIERIQWVPLSVWGYYVSCYIFSTTMRFSGTLFSRDQQEALCHPIPVSQCVSLATHTHRRGTVACGHTATFRIQDKPTSLSGFSRIA